MALTKKVFKGLARITRMFTFNIRYDGNASISTSLNITVV